MNEYRKDMQHLLLAYVLLFLLLCTGTLNPMPEAQEKTLFTIVVDLFKDAALAGVISLLVFILDSVIGSRLKNKLTGLFVIPRTGYVIFSKISAGKCIDDRFTTQDAIEKYKTIIDNLPRDKKERQEYENKEWYKIYYDYQEKAPIVQAQKEYLLCRDMFVATVMFIVLYLLSIAIFQKWTYFSYQYLVILCVIAVLSNIATHRKMQRFVYGVIARDVADDGIP